MATQLTDTDRVLDHHLQTLGAGDLGGVMDDYTEESILVGPEGSMKGREAIRSFFDALISGLFKPGTYQLTLDRRHVEGDVAYILWHARCAGMDIDFASDTFLIRGGKIAVQTFAPRMTPR